MNATCTTLQAIVANDTTDLCARLIYADALEDAGDLELATAHREAVAGLEREQKVAAARARSAKLHGLVVALGERYHEAVHALYTSKRGAVTYGAGGVERLDWDAYGKRGYRNPHTGAKQPAHWCDAGARLDDEVRPTHVVLENSRGRVVARLPLTPLRLSQRRRVLDGPALRRGDLYGVRRELCGISVVTRFGLHGVRYAVTGVALRLPVPERCREQGSAVWGVFCTCETHYWQHGATVGGCKAEYRRKLREAADLS